MTRSRFIALTLIFIAACGGGDAPEDESLDGVATAEAQAEAPVNTTAADGPSSCIVGTWTQASPSFSPKFVFDADGTGEETTAASQGGAVRSFRWAAKGDDEVTITFPGTDGGTDSSTDWGVNCEAGTFAGLYRKQ